MMKFAHLHCHCAHSLLDGLGGPGKWVDAALNLGFHALAITDHGSISSALSFYKKAKEAGIIPVVGCEFYLADDPAHRLSKGEKLKRYHLTVLAKNWNGLQSIFKMLSLANEQFYFKPVLGIDQALDFENCVIMSGCAAGLLSHEEYDPIVRTFHEKYGSDFYLEVMPHELEIQKKVNSRATVLSESLGIPLVATNDAHYPTKDDVLTHDVLLAIQTNAKMTTKGRFSFLVREDGSKGLDDLYLKTCTEMVKSFKWAIDDNSLSLKNVFDAVRSTLEIVDKCSGLEIPKQHFALPRIVEDENSELMRICMVGWKEKIIGRGLDERIYMERLRHELSVIRKIGVIRYFLIVHEIVSWAKNQGILGSVGRGSVGGSLVAYLLNITALDPIQYGLFFERFLREDRIDLPDIDLDFAGRDRDRVIAHVRELYGVENVCQISTVTECHGKLAFRDVARVFDVGVDQVNKISKQIDNDVPLDENFKSNAELRAFAEAYPEVVSHAIRLDGQIRSKGMHAGGVVISEDGFSSRGVLERRKDSAKAINWSMNECEHFGLLKIDILGLETLSVLRDTADLVLERKGVKLDYEKIVPDDPNVLRQFSEGNTLGLFQYESAGIANLCNNLAPIENFETLVHINALYRPGPLDSGMVDSYVKRKRGEESVRYNHKKEEEITKQTLGFPIFQENVMALCVKLAGFSWPEADEVRKAIAKSKGLEAVEKFREKFIDGVASTTPDMSPESANSIFDGFVRFGRYSFNRSMDKETRIRLASGGFKRIAVFVPGDEVLTINSDGNVVKSSVVALHDHGIVPMVEVCFDDWSTERCSLDHKWLTSSGLLPLWSIVQNGDSIISCSKDGLLSERSVKRLHYIGFCQSYDLEVDHPEHNFILESGLCCSNSHSACYSFIGYLTAYVKHHYPHEFLCSLLRSVHDESDQTTLYVAECERVGVKLVYPDVNLSESHFSIHDDSIVVGFSSVKGIGTKAAEELSNARKRGRFETFQDFLARTERRVVNKRVVEALACSGALKSLEPNTKWIVENYPALIAEKAVKEVFNYSDKELSVLRAEFLPGIAKVDDIECEAKIVIYKDILDRLADDIKDCKECSLSKSCDSPVPFKYSRDSKVMVIAEAPGSHEDMKKEPLVGPAGQKMHELFKSTLGLSPGKLFKTNVFNCRPPNNKLPKEVLDECLCGKKWLDQLMIAAKPEVVFAMGNTPLRFFTGKPTGIMKMSGTTFWHPKYKCLIIWSVHPASLLYDRGPDNEELFISALKKLGEYL